MSVSGSETTYFTNWLEVIDKLPSSTWGVFWLSDYDIKREEEAENYSWPRSNSPNSQVGCQMIINEKLTSIFYYAELTLLISN